MLFSAPMVRAELDPVSPKTQTRRTKGLDFKDPDRPRLHGLEIRDGHTVAIFGDSIPDDPVPLEIKCPYGQPGDRLWARETWRCQRFVEWRNAAAGGGGKAVIEWRADGASRALKFPRDAKPPDKTPAGKWRPGIFMPRWACRLELEITGIRCERLKSITPEDAIAEGIAHTEWFEWALFPVNTYAALWLSINGAGSWNKNPWIWVIEHRRIGARHG